MHIFVRSIAATGLFAALAGCASTADKIGPQYVSPLQFSAYGCDQLSLEAQRISARVAQLSGVQDQKHERRDLEPGLPSSCSGHGILVGGNDQNTAEFPGSRRVRDDRAGRDPKRSAALSSGAKPRSKRPRQNGGAGTGAETGGRSRLKISLIGSCRPRMA